MDRAEELELIREVVGLADRKSPYLDAEIGHSPISRYASAERFERERALIFRRKPVIAAHVSELPENNGFLAREIAGLPVILVRDGEGEVRAFLNVCRHRGARLEREAAGCKRVFTCPYHGWSWTNTGELRAVPQEKQGFPDLPRAERGLRRLPAAEAQGFVWIVADVDGSGPVDLTGWLGGRFAADLEQLDLARHRIVAEDRFDIAANWKLLVEGGLEAYHFRVAHAATIAPFFPDNLSTYRMFGPHVRSLLPRNGMLDLRETPEAAWEIRRDANLLYVISPTTQLLVQQDHVVWILMEPKNQELTAIRLVTLAPAAGAVDAAAAAHWAKNQAITRATLMEDFELGEEIQSGFASRGNPSHLFGRFEGALDRFNRAVEEMLEG